MQPTYSPKAAVRNAVYKGMIVLVAICAMSCATPLPPKPETPAERDKRDNVIGLELERQLEGQVKFKRDSEVTVYLRKLAENLAATKPELKATPFGIWLVQDRNGLWRNFSLPGNRVFLSIGLLRSFEFENEVAAEIAMEFGRLANRQVFKRLKESLDLKDAQDGELESFLLPQPGEKPMEVDYFGADGILAFTQAESVEAAKTAVGILYSAGIDPRGLISIWNRYQDNIEQSPYDRSTLSRLLDATHEAIAIYAPLRNPIVRSQAFITIQKRIQRL